MTSKGSRGTKRTPNHKIRDGTCGCEFGRTWDPPHFKTLAQLSGPVMSAMFVVVVMAELTLPSAFAPVGYRTAYEQGCEE